MSNVATYWFGWIVGLFIGAVVTTAIMAQFFHGNTEIVSHNCAHYDSKTGDFTWNDEVKE